MTFLRESGSLFCPQLPNDARGCKTIRRLFIANRGEIACRIIRTCRQIGIVTIAVYPEEDRNSLHVQQADEAIYLGPLYGSEENVYQNRQLLIQKALDSKADAVHPGYGYLSENADFASEVVAAGLTFVGPTSTNISSLGDKRAAKMFLKHHAPNVPLIPGYSGQADNTETFIREADQIGYPILIKAAAGGGGKGMRVVQDRADLAQELSRAQSEAKRSFGNSECILEKYIQQGKHIEIQVIGDKHGNVISLLDRECSVQRRHQKIIEEAPSPWLEEHMRQDMSNAALAVARLLRYEGAGTVEFIVDLSKRSFHFLEVNTRIQVEHPITEEVMGIDIVGLQLFVAAGGNLEGLGITPKQSGHAIECRLCAEDPIRDFMPDTGRIWRWLPNPAVRKTSVVRFETAVDTGSEISVHFDPMIAKIIVWAPVRKEAVEDMISVLKHLVCMGIRTNQLFLQASLLHAVFQGGDYTTSFIPTYFDELIASTRPNSGFLELLALVSVAFLGQLTRSPRPFSSLAKPLRNQTADMATVPSDIICAQAHGGLQLAIWHPSNRSLPEGHFEYCMSHLREDPESNLQSLDDKASCDKKYTCSVGQVLKGNAEMKKHGRIISVNLHKPSVAGATWLAADIIAEVESYRLQLYLAADSINITDDVGRSQRLFCHSAQVGEFVEFHRYSRLAFAESMRQDVASSESSDYIIKAPMPCTVLRVLVKDGASVRKGEILVVVESMKMEMKILATANGTVRCRLNEGQAVQEGTTLCIIE
ncbi:hypothetical protein GQ53DRAFT_851050 [Thozetella sp. PMI_491]|nr:hypothetical protein GQ53DRAFT_851050 [Thozetella sp. PMI_491]